MGLRNEGGQRAEGCGLAVEDGCRWVLVGVGWCCAGEGGRREASNTKRRGSVEFSRGLSKARTAWTGHCETSTVYGGSHGLLPCVTLCHQLPIRFARRDAPFPPVNTDRGLPSTTPASSAGHPVAVCLVDLAFHSPSGTDISPDKPSASHCPWSHASRAVAACQPDFQPLGIAQAEPQSHGPP